MILPLLFLFAPPPSTADLDAALKRFTQGDEIVAINDIALARLNFDQLVGYLSEARQHRAMLMVRRPGNARPMQFVLDPALVDAPSVERVFLLREGVGYIRVSGFDPQTARQFKEAIEKLGGAKLKGLV